MNRLVCMANSLSQLRQNKANSFSNNRPIHSDCGRQSAAIRSLPMSNLSCSSTNSIFWKPSSSRASNSHRLLLHILTKTKQNRLPSVGVKISISCLYLRKDYFFPSLDLLDVFVSLHQQYSPKQRKVHPHLTCAVVSHHPLLIESLIIF